MKKRTNTTTSPETAGIKNMEVIGSTKVNVDVINGELLGKIISMRNLRRGQNNTKWTKEEFEQSMNEFFTYCFTSEIEPSVALMRIWFNVSKTMFYDWSKNPKYEAQHEIVGMALDTIEAMSYGKLDRYPVGSIFKLKTVHGYVENQKIEVTTETKITSEEIADKIAQLAID